MWTFSEIVLKIIDERILFCFRFVFVLNKLVLSKIKLLFYKNFKCIFCTHTRCFKWNKNNLSLFAESRLWYLRNNWKKKPRLITKRDQTRRIRFVKQIKRNYQGSIPTRFFGRVRRRFGNGHGRCSRFFNRFVRRTRNDSLTTV